MQITNKHEFPEAIRNVLLTNFYTPGDSSFSVTELLRPPQMRELMRRHDDKLSEDVVDRIWSLFGSGIHAILQQYPGEDCLVEQRLYTDVLGVRIGGQVDMYHIPTKTLIDFKVTSVWSIIYDSRAKEWEEQLNCYAKLLREAGHDVGHIQVCAILRDYQENARLRNPDYPEAPVKMVPLRVWSPEEVDDFLASRVMIHLSAQDLPDDQLPHCSSEEMWEHPTQYAVMQKGRKRAVKLFADLEEAKAFSEKEQSYYIEERPGTRTRCEKYCPVKEFCSQYKEWYETTKRKK